MTLAPSDVIATCALFVSVCAFVGTIVQTYLTRKHNRLSVRPRIDWASSRVVNKPVSLSLKNDGLGPAILESLHISYGGREFLISKDGLPNDLHEALTRDGPMIEFYMPGPGSTLSAGSPIALMTCHGSTESIVAHNRAVSLINAIGFRLTYRSMYGESFGETREPTA